MALSLYTDWRVRPNGNNANGGGFDASVASPGTDRSQQDSPQVTLDGVTVTASNAAISDTVTLAGYTVLTADAGNVVHITGGTNFTVGWYTIIAVNTGSNTWQFDRTCTTGAGAAMTGRMGGAWADFWTNTTAGAAIVGPGNCVYILGGASPSVASPDYAPAASFIPVSGTATVGLVYFIGDPNTPSNNGYNGKPLIKTPGLLFTSGSPTDFIAIRGLSFVANTGTGNQVISAINNEPCWVVECVFDQNGYDIGLWTANAATNAQSGKGGVKLIGNEVYSSVAKRTTNLNPAIAAQHYGAEALFNNIHDCIGDGIFQADAYWHSMWNISANNGGVGIKFSYGNPGGTQLDTHHNGIENCTIDGNAGDGIYLDNASDMILTHIYNCLITNHTGVGKYGINVATGSATANGFIRRFVDYNTFYGNTTDTNNLNYGANSAHGGSNPYVGRSTENYTLA